jgi:hypothetical protein
MKRFYKNVEFKVNYKSDKIIKREMTHFYDNSDYHYGRFHRVQLPMIIMGIEYDYIKYINTFLYLNPNLNQEIYVKFFKYCIKNIKDFNVNYKEYNEILLNKSNLLFTDCYRVIRRIVYNEKKLAKTYNLNIYDKYFKFKLKDNLGSISKKWWDEANKEILKDSFLNSLDNIYLSYESLSLDHKLSIETVKKHLNNYNIFIRDNELEYEIIENVYDDRNKIIGVNKPKKVILKRQPFDEYIIEKQIKYLLSKSNTLFSMKDIVDGCKYYSQYYNETIQIEKSKIEKWVNENPYYLDLIKKHIKTFRTKKEIIIRQNKLILLLNIINNNNNNKSQSQQKIEYHRNKSGKIVVSNYFGEEFNQDYSIGNYNTKYSQKYDIDKELEIEEFEL